VVEVGSKDNPKPEEIVVVGPEGGPLPTEARASKDGRNV
jgi:16S rRNA U1498 N3-methylase RsmE